jgi:hypothetical protein
MEDQSGNSHPRYDNPGIHFVIDDHIADPCQWKMDRSGSFRKAIEFYVDNIPSGRGRVLIPLFGKETKLLAEAAEEVFVKFRNKCLIITESET